MTDSHWVRWHDSYADPASSLSRRLRRVQHRVAQALDDQPDGDLTVLSLCAGDGRDLLEPLSRHRRRPDVRAVLVELDPSNAERARSTVSACGLDRVEVRQADAGDPTHYRDIAPVDLLLACGIFGNISDDDIHRTVAALPSLLRPPTPARPGGRVLWTRHRRDPDLTPTIRTWFSECGFTEVGFDTEPGHHYAVGCHQLDGPAAAGPTTGPLFTFLGDGGSAVSQVRPPATRPRQVPCSSGCDGSPATSRAAPAGSR